MTKFTRTFLLLSGVLLCFIGFFVVLGAAFGGGPVAVVIILALVFAAVAMITDIILFK
jgi:hypothetical protein